MLFPRLKRRNSILLFVVSAICLASFLLSFYDHKGASGFSPVELLVDPAKANQAANVDSTSAPRTPLSPDLSPEQRHHDEHDMQQEAEDSFAPHHDVSDDTEHERERERARREDSGQAQTLANDAVDEPHSTHPNNEQVRFNVDMSSSNPKGLLSDQQGAFDLEKPTALHHPDVLDVLDAPDAPDAPDVPTINADPADHVDPQHQQPEDLALGQTNQDHLNYDLHHSPHADNSTAATSSSSSSSPQHSNDSSPVFTDFWSRKMFANKTIAKGFSIIVLVGGANTNHLKNLAEYYAHCPSLHSMYFVLNNPSAPIPADFASWKVTPFPKKKGPIHIEFAYMGINSLNNRFIPPDSLSTLATLSIDDDRILDPLDIEQGYSYWVAHQDAIVGWFPTMTMYPRDSSLGSYIYGASPGASGRHYCLGFLESGLNLLLTGGALFHSKYLSVYTYGTPKPALDMVETHMNCEDILFNFAVANYTMGSRTPTLALVAGGTRVIERMGNVQLHRNNSEHFSYRSTCVQRLVSEHYFHVPKFHYEVIPRPQSLSDHSAFQNILHPELLPANYDAEAKVVNFVSKCIMDTTQLTAFVRKPVIRIGVIMDEFSFECFRHEASVFQLSYKDWRTQLRREQPHFVLIESAWQVDLPWNRMFFPKPQERRGGATEFVLMDLLIFCQTHNIPTVFWNKEDPSSFPYFSRSPTLPFFTHVFTTDAGVISEYQRVLNRQERIGVLQFAAQPILHNPINSVVVNPSDFLGQYCFFGSYNYNKEKFPNRHLDFEKILSPVAESNADLYILNRAHGKDNVTSATSKYVPFPAKYSKYLHAAASNFEEVSNLYKKCNIHLNVNSISNSTTMFARRVFEVMASNKAVLSFHTPAYKHTFGNEKLVPSASTEEETRAWLHTLANNIYRERLANCGSRAVLRGHTYRHRLLTIIETLGLQHTLSPHVDLRNSPGVAIVLTASTDHSLYDCSEARITRVLGWLAGQTLGRKEVVFVARDLACLKSTQRVLAEYYANVTADAASTPAAASSKPQQVAVVHYNECEFGECISYGIRHTTSPLIAFIDLDVHYYGSGYLEDLSLSFTYNNAAIAGKAAYYSLEQDKELKTMLKLTTGVREHRHVPCLKLFPATLMLNRLLFDQDIVSIPLSVSDLRGVRDHVCSQTTRLQQTHPENKYPYTVYSANRFDFVALPEADPNFPSAALLDSPRLFSAVDSSCESI